MYFAEDEDEDEADAVGLLGGARDGSGDDMFVGWFGCFWWLGLELGTSCGGSIRLL